MIGKILFVALLGSVLVESNPLPGRGKRSPPDQATSSFQNDEKQTQQLPSTSEANTRTFDISLEENSPLKFRKIESESRCSDLNVWGISPETTPEKLRAYFEKFGELSKAEVRRDTLVRNEVFGLIRFSNFPSQFRCLTARHEINGRFCVVEISHCEFQQSTNNTIFVGGCAEDFTIDDLHGYFSKFGYVTDAFISKISPRFSFVTFYDPEVAQSLLCSSMNHAIKGVSVRIHEMKPKSSGVDPTSNNQAAMFQEAPDNKIFVGGCASDLTRDDIRDYFSKFGRVTNIFISNSFPKYSFVTFHDHKVAESLLRSPMDHVIKGVLVYIARAKPKSTENKPDPNNQKAPDNKIFVRGCLDDLTRDDLREYFSNFGHVTDVFISNSSPKYSFVTFYDPIVVQGLLSIDAIHTIKGGTIFISKVKPKSEKKNSNDKIRTYANMRGHDIILPFGGNMQAPGTIGWNNGLGASVSTFDPWAINTYSPVLPIVPVHAASGSLMNSQQIQEYHRSYPFLRFP